MHAFSASTSQRRLVARVHEHLRKGDIAEDHRKQVIEIMGDPSRKDAHGFEFSRLQQLLFHPFLVRDIPENDDRPEERAILVADG